MIHTQVIRVPTPMALLKQEAAVIQELSDASVPAKSSWPVFVARTTHKKPTRQKKKSKKERKEEGKKEQESKKKDKKSGRPAPKEKCTEWDPPAEMSPPSRLLRGKPADGSENKRWRFPRRHWKKSKEVLGISLGSRTEADAILNPSAAFDLQRYIDEVVQRTEQAEQRAQRAEAMLVQVVERQTVAENESEQTLVELEVARSSSMAVEQLISNQLEQIEDGSTRADERKADVVAKLFARIHELEGQLQNLTLSRCEVHKDQDEESDEYSYYWEDEEEEEELDEEEAGDEDGLEDEEEEDESDADSSESNPQQNLAAAKGVDGRKEKAPEKTPEKVPVQKEGGAKEDTDDEDPMEAISSQAAREYEASAASRKPTLNELIVGEGRGDPFEEWTKQTAQKPVAASSRLSDLPNSPPDSNAKDEVDDDWGEEDEGWHWAWQEEGEEEESWIWAEEEEEEEEDEEEVEEDVAASPIAGASASLSDTLLPGDLQSQRVLPKSEESASQATKDLQKAEKAVKKGASARAKGPPVKRPPPAKAKSDGKGHGKGQLKSPAPKVKAKSKGKAPSPKPKSPVSKGRSSLKQPQTARASISHQDRPRLSIQQPFSARGSIDARTSQSRGSIQLPGKQIAHIANLNRRATVGEASEGLAKLKAAQEKARALAKVGGPKQVAPKAGAKEPPPPKKRASIA